MTKRCLKIKLCLTVISECDIRYLSPISLTETERDRREEGGALPARVEWELRQGGLADCGRAQLTAQQRTTARQGRAADPPCVRLSVRPPSAHQSPPAQAAGPEPVRCLDEKMRRDEMRGARPALSIRSVHRLSLDPPPSTPCISVALSLYSVDLLALLIFC